MASEVNGLVDEIERLLGIETEPMKTWLGRLYDVLLEEPATDPAEVAQAALDEARTRNTNGSTEFEIYVRGLIIKFLPSVNTDTLI